MECIRLLRYMYNIYLYIYIYLFIYIHCLFCRKIPIFPNIPPLGDERLEFAGWSPGGHSLVSDSLLLFLSRFLSLSPSVALPFFLSAACSLSLTISSFVFLTKHVPDLYAPLFHRSFISTHCYLHSVVHCIQCFPFLFVILPTHSPDPSSSLQTLLCFLPVNRVP